MTAPQSAFDPRWLAGLDTLAEQATGLSEPNPRVACRIIAPDGRAFYSGPDQTMRSLDTSGGGSWQSLGQRDTTGRDYGGRAMFNIGKILVAGGGLSLSSARVINLNGTTPQVSTTSPMATGRRQLNLTVLADGSVLARSVPAGGGTWNRSYPTGSLFAQAVGYDIASLGSAPSAHVH